MPGSLEKSAGQTAATPPPLVPFEDIVPTWDRHISIDDAQAFVQISSPLSRKKGEECSSAEAAQWRWPICEASRAF